VPSKLAPTTFDTLPASIPTLSHLGSGIDQWSDGDFDLNGSVTFDDLLALAQNYGVGSVVDGQLSASFQSEWAAARSLVPEPTALSMLAAVSLMARRRRALQ
jgi:hypothetical protein